MDYQQYNRQPKKSPRVFLLLLIGFLAMTAVGITVWFTKQKTLPNPHAAAATTLSFNPSKVTVSVGQPVSADIMVDPATNKVSLVKIVLNYDKTLLQINSSSLSVNATAFPQTLDAPLTSCSGNQCTITATYSVGSDPTKAIQTVTKVATFKATLLSANTSTVTVPFTAKAAAYSIASTDQAAEDILSSATPLIITTQGGACIPNQSTCSWDSMDSVTTYHYIVVDDTGNTVQQGDVNAPQTNVNFPSVAGKTYTCIVSAVNACGKGNEGKGTSTCPLPSTSPTPSVCEGPGDVTNIRINCPNCQGQ